ncbi:TorD/DmsD family molecular chaperone [Acerihabitans arboris]|uniref:Cytoplasmic chaperone TorD family protein n=1 Tax=Acerihabitans arboris TaxID=2691583 RepID=A0A845SFA8_9GAMM|nr:molecular chaperone TorD family protein [Acerihabitans arboris]NDL61624.1 cytoplasmic chaperone TorD family protein [Acerihabitans arboris]
MTTELNTSAKPGELSSLSYSFSLSDWNSVGLLLRDFYMFSQRETLIHSVNKLEEHCGAHITFPASFADADWQDAEYDFNRLFVGPQALLAPPYASVYIEKEPQLMGNSTQEIRELLHALGLSSRNENQIPDDHVSYEIELCLLLINHIPRQHVYEEALAWLVGDHMSRWLPKFIVRIEHGAQTPLLFAISKVLSLWFDDLRRRIS